MRRFAIAIGAAPGAAGMRCKRRDGARLADMVPDPADRDLPRPARTVVFVVLLALMGFGPCYRQLLGGESEWFRAWEMYRETGTGIADVHYEQRRPDGRLVAIDRYRLLGHALRREAPISLQRIEGRAGVWKVAQQLCDALEVGADVRARSRVASLRGWEPGDAGDHNLCDAESPDDPASPDRERLP